MHMLELVYLDTICFAYPSCFVDRHSNGHYGSDGYNDSKFPVHLKGPEDYCIRLEQIKGIQSLENKKKSHKRAKKECRMGLFCNFEQTFYILN